MDRKVRWILGISLGGLLLLLAVAGTAGMAALRRVRDAEAGQRALLRNHAAWLRRVENGIYLSGTLARDYFADPTGADAPALQARLTQLETDTKRAVEQSPAELRGDVVTYWRMLNLMMELARKRTTPGLDAYFRRQLTERRESMLRIADRAGSTFDVQWTQGQSQLTQMYAQLWWLLALELTLVLGLGLLVSISGARRLLKLERERASLAGQLERAQEDERRAIARELHDEIGQSVSGMVLDLARAAGDAAGEDRSKLSAIAAAGERTIEAVRRIALSLRPSMLDDLGLVAALEWQAREVGNRTGLHIEVDAPDAAGKLPEAQQTCLYRIAQEALQNCARHAQASHARVALSQSGKLVSLQVEDDGKGFQTSRTRGLGILGMEERAGRMGGRFKLRSEPGRGTVLSVELPL